MSLYQIICKTRMKKIIFLSFAIIFQQIVYSSELITRKEESHFKRSFSFSSGYLEGNLGSNEGLSYFPLTAIQGYSKIFDLSTQNWANTPGYRAISLLASFPVSYWFADSLYLSYHEYGHFQAARSIGIDGSYNVPYHGETGIHSFWETYVLLLLSPPEDIIGMAPSVNTYANRMTSESERIHIAAAGINNSTLMAKKLENQIYRTGAHVTDFTYYHFIKLDGMLYALDNSYGESNDINNVVRMYQSKGYGITRDNIANQYSLNLLSGTTLSFIKSYYDYIATGNNNVYSLEWMGMRFPEVNSYLNPNGLSIELSTSFRFSDYLIGDLSYETITMGEKAQQLTPGLSYQLASLFPKLNNCWVSTNLVLGKGIGGGIEAKWQPKNDLTDRLSYTLKYINYNKLNLYGARYSPDLIHGNSNSSVIAVLNYDY